MEVADRNHNDEGRDATEEGEVGLAGCSRVRAKKHKAIAIKYSRKSAKPSSGRAGLLALATRSTVWNTPVEPRITPNTAQTVATFPIAVT